MPPPLSAIAPLPALCTAGLLALAASVAAAGEPVASELKLRPLTFQPPAEAAPSVPSPPASPRADEPAPLKSAETRFGRAGSSWLTFAAGGAWDFGDERDYVLSAAYSHFFADEMEFSVELGGWYFDQVGDNTGGVSGIMYFRWHALHADDYRWTVYADVGIGLLAGFDDVPDGGRIFNFVPRAGVGFTQLLNDDGMRLQAGIRWHHISNGRYTGDARNPSRDSAMIYVGLMIPFGK